MWQCYSTVQRKLYIEYRARFAFERETFERVSSVSLLESRYLSSFAKREARFESSRCELKKFSRNEIRVSSIREVHDLNALLSGLEINLDVIPVIMASGSLILPVTAEFMPVIVTP